MTIDYILLNQEPNQKLNTIANMVYKILSITHIITGNVIKYLYDSIVSIPSSAVEKKNNFLRGLISPHMNL